MISSYPLIDPDSPLSHGAAPLSEAPTEPVRTERRKKNRRRGPDALSQIPSACTGLAWVLMGVAWMCWDRSAPRSHGVDALVGVREHAVDPSLAAVALGLLAVVVLLSLGGLWARSVRGRRKSDSWPVSLIVLGGGAALGFCAIALQLG